MLFANVVLNGVAVEERSRWTAVGGAFGCGFGLLAMVVARTLAWTHRLTFRAAFMRLLAGEDQRTVAADLREQATRAYDLLEAGLGGYGVAGDG